MIDIQMLDQEHKAFTFADFERRRQLMRRIGDEKALAELEKEIAKVEAYYASTTPERTGQRRVVSDHRKQPWRLRELRREP